MADAPSDSADDENAGGDAGASAEDVVLFAPPPMEEQERMVEALLFASPDPMTVAAMADRMPHGAAPAEAVEALRRRYAGRGVELRQVGKGWAFRTAADLAFLMRREQVEKKRLSRAAVETLAIIAYHQPTSRAEIEEIRGVSVSKGTIDLLLELGWIKLGRRRMTPGRPVTFMTTMGFLDHFGLETPSDLPGVQELKAAGLLDNRTAVAFDDGPGADDDEEDDDEREDDERRRDDTNDMFE